MRGCEDQEKRKEMEQQEKRQRRGREVKKREEGREMSSENERGMIEKKLNRKRWGFRERKQKGS